MNLKELRSFTGLSQAKFASKFSIPLSTYCHWEQGMRTPPKYVIDMVQTILELEGVLSNEIQEHQSNVTSEQLAKN